MNDYEKLKQLFTEFGIEFKESEEPSILCEKGKEKIIGYNGFFTIFDFDKDGKFIAMGCWE